MKKISKFLCISVQNDNNGDGNRRNIQHNSGRPSTSKIIHPICQPPDPITTQLYSYGSKESSNNREGMIKKNECNIKPPVRNNGNQTKIVPRVGIISLSFVSKTAKPRKPRFPGNSQSESTSKEHKSYKDSSSSCESMCSGIFMKSINCVVSEGSQPINNITNKIDPLNNSTKNLKTQKFKQWKKECRARRKSLCRTNASGDLISNSLHKTFDESTDEDAVHTIPSRRKPKYSNRTNHGEHRKKSHQKNKANKASEGKVSDKACSPPRAQHLLKGPQCGPSTVCHKEQPSFKPLERIQSKQCYNGLVIGNTTFVRPSEILSLEKENMCKNGKCEEHKQTHKSQSGISSTQTTSIKSQKLPSNIGSKNSSNSQTSDNYSSQESSSTNQGRGIL